MQNFSSQQQSQKQCYQQPQEQECGDLEKCQKFNFKQGEVPNKLILADNKILQPNNLGEIDIFGCYYIKQNDSQPNQKEKQFNQSSEEKPKPKNDRIKVICTTNNDGQQLLNLIQQNQNLQRHEVSDIHKCQYEANSIDKQQNNLPQSEYVHSNQCQSQQPTPQSSENSKIRIISRGPQQFPSDGQLQQQYVNNVTQNEKASLPSCSAQQQQQLLNNGQQQQEIYTNSDVSQQQKQGKKPLDETVLKTQQTRCYGCNQYIQVDFKLLTCLHVFHVACLEQLIVSQIVAKQSNVLCNCKIKIPQKIVLQTLRENQDKASEDRYFDNQIAYIVKQDINLNADIQVQMANKNKYNTWLSDQLKEMLLKK